MSETDLRWLEKLGLERDPFPESETPGDFFSRGGRERQMELLANVGELSRPLVAVIGESGVGKTTFFHALLGKLPSEAQVARVTAGVFLSAKALLQAIARAMGVTAEPDESSSTLRARLHERIGELADAGTPCVVLVDDAGELEADALDELVQIAELGRAPQRGATVMVFALPGVRDALARAAGAERVDPLVQEVMLDRYSLNELRGYLQFRLARAGLKGSSPFSEDEYQEIFRRSGGLPGRANGVAARLLRTRRSGLASRLGASLDADRIKWIGGGVAAALVLGGALLMLLATGGDSAGSKGFDGDGNPSPPVTDRAPSSSARPAPDSSDTVADTASDAATVRASPAAPTPDGRAAADPGAEGESQVAPMLTPAQTGGFAWMDVTRDDVSTQERRASSAGSAAPASEPSGSNAAPAPQPASAPAAATTDDVADDRARLLGIDPERFTLQVLVNSSSARTREWIDARPESARYRFYRRVRDGAPQYVTLYGDFPDRAAASRAAEQVGGYPRSMGDVQKDLAAP